MTSYPNDKPAPTAEIELHVEAIEEVITPGMLANHNETVEVELAVEEAEEVIAPGLTLNHNEALEVR